VAAPQGFDHRKRLAAGWWGQASGR